MENKKRISLWHFTIVRSYVAIFAAFAFLTALTAFVSFSYARQEIGKEFVDIRQSTLAQVARQSGKSLGNLRTFGQRVAYDNELSRMIAEVGPEAEESVRAIINDLVTEYNYDRNVLMSDIYAMGYHGLYTSAYNTKDRTLEQLLETPVCAPLFNGDADMVFLPTEYEESGTGLLRYTFRMVFSVSDLVSGMEQGVIMLVVPEAALYRLYQTYLSAEDQMMIIDENGIVLSSFDKTQIGTSCSLNVRQLEELNAQEDVLDRIHEDQFWLYERITGTDWYLLNRQDVSQVFTTLGRVQRVMLLISFVVILLFLIVLVPVMRRMLNRVMGIRDAMAQVAGGDFSLQIATKNKDEFGSIETSFNTVVQTINESMEALREKERQKRMAELDFLRAQINPHLIHNTLTSIRFQLEMGKYTEAEEMLFSFSKLLRQTLSRSDEFVLLQDEISVVQNYAALQKYRYPEAFGMEYDLQPEAMEALVPTLILQPIVENALFHALGKSFVTICIRTRIEGGLLLVSVSDDGMGMSEETAHTVLERQATMNHVGLRNIHERLQVMFGEQYGLKIESTLGEGTTVAMTLPFTPGSKEM